MDRDQVMRWVEGYVAAWRAEDPERVERLFTEDARYRRSPYEESEVGHDAIKAFWLEDAGEVFTAVAEPVAIEGRQAVVRVEVRYGEPVDQEYRDLRTMTGSPLRRLQELAAVLGGGLVRVSERRRRRIARAACQSAVEPLDP